jgi:MFS family permease
MNADKSQRLFLGSFLTLIAAGVGFSARAAVLGQWGAEYGFTKAELGVITGFGLTGFGLTVIFFSILVERWGYGFLLALTFIFHVLSAVITLLAGPVFHAFGKDAAFWCLSLGTTIFSLGNGASEAAINPLIAVLHPQERTHRLNILHAGWPGGLILGALLGVILKNQRWELILLTYVIPTLIYGLLLFGQKFPASQAKMHRLSMGNMLREFQSPMLLFLLLLMAMVGFVELGTDSWISNITGNLLDNPTKGLYLFIWTSSLMFALRFCAGPIVHRISPLGLLFSGACLGTLGLFLLSHAGGAFQFGSPWVAAWLAVTIYAMGKTFYWPTMLGVVSERFPAGGALTLGAVGCVGTLSAGLLGGPTIGFMQDYFAAKHLRDTSPQTYERYRAEKPNSLLWIFQTTGLDGSKVAVISDNGKQLQQDLAILQNTGKTDAHLQQLNSWWQSSKSNAELDAGPVVQASLHGSRMALRCTAIVPAFMAVGFLLLIRHFRSKGGYEEIHLDGPISSGSDEPVAAEPLRQ